MKTILRIVVLSAGLVSLPLSSLHADPVRLSGAAAICTALTAVKADLEQASGESVVLISKNAGKGLQDVFAGTCDIAMVAGSMEKAAAGANQEKPGSVDLSALKSTVVGKETILFVVHPSNPVSALTADQVKAILTGAVKNWAEVGGTDGAVEIFTLGSRNGPRIVVDEQVMAGAAMVSTAIPRETPKDICPIVAQKPNSFSFLGKSSLGPGVKTLSIDKAVTMPTFLATKGEPSAAAAKVIRAAQTLLNK
ncbi:MAG: substrate-binding domain-containing protein [Opitutae bacterium]|nr:substrate-binding domain-containing protein [Opitutae bacterium]